MCRRDKPDVVTAAILQLEHHLGKPLVRDLVLSLLFPGLRDLVILAIDAAKIAVAEKDIASAACSRQDKALRQSVPCRTRRSADGPSSTRRSRRSGDRCRNPLGRPCTSASIASSCSTRSLKLIRLQQFQVLRFHSLPFIFAEAIPPRLPRRSILDWRLLSARPCGQAPM